jgi:glutamyl-tRNA synthetase
MSSPAKPRVRFAPSPTGYLHVGGARTALFNWLYAKREGGTFVLRIEDTDQDRNKPELVDGILASLRWLGLEWDEGPFYQSQRTEMYAAAAKRILAEGNGFACYCKGATYAGGDHAPDDTEDEESKEDIAASQATVHGVSASKVAGASASSVFKAAPCPCRDFSDAQRAEKDAAGIPFAIRFKVPRTGSTKFEDAVFGVNEVQNADIEDFVLLRSNGVPTYQLSVVVDDIDMRISHIIRGADHISNTPKQLLIYRALGAEPPIFAHVPLILGTDRHRLSKRHGATSVSSYEDEGFLPEAFRNFLALLGWAPGNNEEYLRTPELIEKFSLAGISRSNGVFDRAKLEWYNTQYLQKTPVEYVVPYVEGQLKRDGLWQEKWGTTDKPWLARAVDLIRPRTRLLGDFTSWARGFFTDDFEYDVEAREKFWKDEKIPGLLAKATAALEALPDWNHDACDAAARAVATAEGVKAGVLINAIRVAIVGRAVAPPLFDTMVVIGRDAILRRMHKAVDYLAARSAGK